MLTFADWRIVRYDKLNLTVENRRAAKSNNGKGDAEVRWRPTNRYFQSLPAALRYVRNQTALDLVGDGDQRVTVDELIERIIAQDAIIAVALSEARVNP